MRFSGGGDGQLVYTASTDQSILALDAHSGKAQARKKDAHNTAINRLAATGATGLASGAPRIGFCLQYRSVDWMHDLHYLRWS